MIERYSAATSCNHQYYEAAFSMASYSIYTQTDPQKNALARSVGSAADGTRVRYRPGLDEHTLNMPFLNLGKKTRRDQATTMNVETADAQRLAYPQSLRRHRRALCF